MNCGIPPKLPIILGHEIVGVVESVGDGFMFTEGKTNKGSVIGSRKDMLEVLKLASEGSIEVVCESFQMNQANEILDRLKHSKVETRVVLTL